MANDDNGRNDVEAVGVTSEIVSRAPTGQYRKNIIITNTSGGAHVITVHKGTGAAVGNEGIPLQVNERYVDYTLNENNRCWQGSISVISSLAAGQISISEEME